MRACIEAAEPPKMLKHSKDAHNISLNTFGQDEHLRKDETVVPIVYRRCSDVIPKPILWLWPGRIARGKVSMLAGNPGLGKSQITANMAAIITTGGYWPVDRTHCDVGNVIFISAEDDAEDTIRPRLEAAGADLSRIFFLDAVMENG